MAIEDLISTLDVHLTDERVLAAAQQFLTANGYRLQYDAVTVVFPADVEVRILDKSLVVHRQTGAYLTARAVFNPVVSANGSYSGHSRHGTLEIILSLAGEYLDDVYSRSMVI